MRFPLDPHYAVLGLTEGIIVALGLGAKYIFEPADVQGGNIVLNSGIFAAVVNLTTSLFTELHEARADLLNIERKMVISQRGKLFRTALYRTGRRRALGKAASYGATAFVGASIPLIPVYFTSRTPFLGLLLPLLSLFGLGFYLGRGTIGNPFLWGAGMTLAGIFVGVVGLFFPA